MDAGPAGAGAAGAEAGGVVVMNTQKASYSGWCRLEKASLREMRNAKSLRDTETGAFAKLRAAGADYYFWVERLPGESVRRYVPDTAEPELAVAAGGPELKTDAAGWPVSIRWEGMERPLFDGEAPRLYVSRFVAGGWWGATGRAGGLHLLSGRDDPSDGNSAQRRLRTGAFQ